MNLEKRTFEVRFAPRATDTTDTQASTGNTLAGHAAVFNSPSHDLGGFVERVAPGAFARSLASGENIFALWAHDTKIPLGSTRGGKLTLSEDETGLAFSLDTSRFTPAQLGAAEDGELRMSFGFVVRADAWTELVDGSYERTLLDVDLFEVSPVINPAYPDSTAGLRSLDAWREARAADVAPETREADPIETPEPEAIEPRNNSLRRKELMLRKLNSRKH